MEHRNFRYFIIFITLILSRYIPSALEIIRFINSLGYKGYVGLIFVILILDNLRLRFLLHRKKLKESKIQNSSEEGTVDIATYSVIDLEKRDI